ncbi:hypothetical protein GCM10007989_08620 [Devosia pacifica]|uniref:DUF2336 domain-containing protein n=1 Tax=Devosia pacifica TaxID=1335967 RepID=A0A918VR14_9HYPH|nr:DUF2336 domain-containing protein [Devosia pacifica]GHA15964.1 hypothetical protein GCM10007989_08620 [Devosia pacifica]
MAELDEGHRAFSSFRVLSDDHQDTEGEREQLFRNMAKLFSYVSDRCDDDQIAQYDDVLCQLAALVELEARVEVAELLSPLNRAPGTVILRLANDEIEVARPLLEFSSVLGEDDLIDIVINKSEAHRTAIAGRQAGLTEKVGAALVEHGGSGSVTQLVRNPKAEFARETLERLIERSDRDPEIADSLRNRPDIDWNSVRSTIDRVSRSVMAGLEDRAAVDPVAADKVNAAVYARMRNNAGFNASEWKSAYNQVRALGEKRQLDSKALARFARFSYGHHAAATISVLYHVPAEVLVKWLAMQDYAAMTVVLRAAEVDEDIFDKVMAVLPWRDLPSEEDRKNVRVRFDALNRYQAREILETWRKRGFRRQGSAPVKATA